MPADLPDRHPEPIVEQMATFLRRSKRPAEARIAEAFRRWPFATVAQVDRAVRFAAKRLMHDASVAREFARTLEESAAAQRFRGPTKGGDG